MGMCSPMFFLGFCRRGFSLSPSDLAAVVRRCICGVRYSFNNSKVLLMFRSDKLTRAAQYFDCQSCGKYRPSVPAHANWHQYGKGGGLKAHDCYVAFVCQDCHSVIDGKCGVLSRNEQREMWEEAWRKTVLLWFESGLVTVKAMKG